MIDHYVSQTSKALAEKKEDVLLDIFTEILGEDFMLLNLHGRLSRNMINLVETYYLDDKPIVVFYPVESEMDGNIITFTQKWRKLNV